MIRRLNFCLKTALYLTTVALILLLGAAGHADNTPGREELLRIAREGLKENPAAWFYSNTDRIVRVMELTLPATPQTEIMDGKLYFNAEIACQQVNSSAKRLEHRRGRFRLQCRNDNGAWKQARVEQRGDWELGEFVSMEREAMAALPNLSNTPLDQLMGEAIAAPVEAAPVNPLEQYTARIAAVSSGDGANPADGSVAKVKEQLAAFVRAFSGTRPDWAGRLAAHQAIDAVYSAEGAFKEDPRRAELREIWVALAAASNALSDSEVALYRDRNSDRRKELDRQVRETYNNISFLRATSRYEDAMKKLDAAVAEVAYVIALAPNWANIVWRTGQVQPQEAKLSEVLAAGRAGLEEARQGYLRVNEAAMQRELQSLRQAHDAGYLDGVAALEAAKKMPDGSPSDAQSKISKYETAYSYIDGFRNMLKTALGRYPLLAERDLAGTKLSVLYQRATDQRGEARDGIDALAIRVRDDARAAYQAWVRSLQGDQKRIFESAGSPSERRGDIWYYRVSTGGFYTTTIYTFRGNTLIGTRSVPWRE